MKPAPYNLITPVKDEEEHLPMLAQCVISQSQLPDVWVIVDDGSTDATPQIIDELTARHPWICSIRIEERVERTFGSHFAGVVRRGLDKSTEIAAHAQYLIKVDADVRFHDNTFKIIVDAMDCHADLAIASPRLMTLREEVDVEELKHPEVLLKNSSIIVRTDEKRVNEPTDGIRIYRKRFLDEIGGFPVNDASADVVLGKAVMKGYRISFVDGIWGYQTRDMGTTLKSDYVRGKFKGYRLYIAHYHLLLVAASFIWDVFSRPSWAGGVFIGYLESLVRRKKRIDDPDIKRYYGRERFKTVFRFINRRFAGLNSPQGPHDHDGQ